MGAPLN
jgi:hypothetical protein